MDLLALKTLVKDFITSPEEEATFKSVASDESSKMVMFLTEESRGKIQEFCERWELPCSQEKLLEPIVLLRSDKELRFPELIEIEGQVIHTSGLSIENTDEGSDIFFIYRSPTIDNIVARTVEMLSELKIDDERNERVVFWRDANPRQALDSNNDFNPRLELSVYLEIEKA